MNPAQYIRKAVFNMTQAKFAELLQISQPAVARMEAKGRIFDDYKQRVRELGQAECAKRGMVWSDTLFFDVPPHDEAEAA